MILHNLDSNKIKSSFGLDSIDKKTLITCPHCKTAQYLAEEIFMSSTFFGKPKDIVKDALGTIIYVDYPEDKEPVRLESYTCDYCNKPFVVEATVAYKAMEETPAKDFSSPYVSLIDD